MKLVDGVISISAACPLDILHSQIHLDEMGGRLWRRTSAQSQS